VDRAFDAAGVNGHRLDGAPSIMAHIHPNYYVADERLVEVVCHEPE
jgi:hypothetical protein